MNEKNEPMTYADEANVKQHEEDGIIFFDEPYVRKPGEFGFDHINSDYIFRDRNFQTKTEMIVAYAKDEKHNRKLQDVKNRLSGTSGIQMHVGEWMLNGI